MEQRHETLFVGNLDHAVKRHDLENSLYELFVPFGHILQITVKKERSQTKAIHPKYSKPMSLMKQIAFVVFADEANANTAKTRLNGFKFFGREICVHFARKRSDAACLQDGTYDFAALNARKNKNLADRGAAGGKITIRQADSLLEDVGAGRGGAVVNKNVGDVSTTLVIENLSEFLTEEVMRPLFEQFPGLEEVKHFATQNRMKVEFRHEDHAQKCLQELQGFNVDGRTFLSIVYGM
eukprot:g14348.t1